ncbi:MAG: hypothetical protein ACD_28C00347G0005 [uncultured bacterium]|nr:MAG: hypothetical protein ACD_28C00347G0005 [uncultured bacterium]KKT76948.1 MAG: hypothetical protein UW70_C0007G0005 [Candidatus Peregrinibacteria bacterium GW2011_GWA2_44_7]
MKKISNIDNDQLKRGKYSSTESKLDWLFSALTLAQATKVIKKTQIGQNR